MIDGAFILFFGLFLGYKATKWHYETTIMIELDKLKKERKDLRKFLNISHDDKFDNETSDRTDA